jgi:hypothetical protein
MTERGHGMSGERGGAGMIGEAIPLRSAISVAVGCWYGWAVTAGVLLGLRTALARISSERPGELDVTLLVIGLVIYAVAWLAALSYVVRRFAGGRGWARWMLAVLWLVNVPISLNLIFTEVASGTPEGAVGGGTVWLVVVISAAAQFLIGLGAIVGSWAPDARTYFAVCRATRLAARPTPGPAPKPVRYAGAAWCAGGLLYGAAGWLSLGDGGFRASDLADPMTWVIWLGMPLGFLVAARFLAVGSVVARRWLVALSVVVILSAALSFGGLSTAAFILLALAAVTIVAAAVLTFRSSGRAFTRSAQPR